MGILPLMAIVEMDNKSEGTKRSSLKCFGEPGRLLNQFAFDQQYLL